MENKYTLGILVHSEAVAKLVASVVNDILHICHIKVTTYESAVEDATELLNAGCDVLVCHGGSREAIYRVYGHCTVIIERSDIDLLLALRQAMTVTDTVMLTSYATEHREIELLQKITGMHIYDVRYYDHIELEKILRSYCEKGLNIAVGGGGTAAIMNRLGGKTFLDIPRIANIRSALQRAIALARLRQMELEYMGNLKAITNAVREGMICVRSNGKVIFANSTALKLTGSFSLEINPSILNQLMTSEVLADGEPRNEFIITINKKNVLVSTFPLRISVEEKGVVTFLYDIESLQGINTRINKGLYQRGFRSKYHIYDIIGTDESMIRLRQQVQLYASTDLCVHILGETGTGKELIAHAIHSESTRKQFAFVPINCSALPDSLLESELFGYEEGAFTGARKGGKIGLFELANKGILFLDEIGGISAAMQLRLLRVLEASEFMRIGGDRIISIDVRIISASHTPLFELVKAGTFRADLYYRLIGLTIIVPPLRQRGQDISVLANLALSRHGKKTDALTSNMRTILSNYSWPGNVRELFSIMDNYAVLLGNMEHSEVILRDIFLSRGIEIPSSTSDKQFSLAEPANVTSKKIDGYLKKKRKAMIEHAIEQSGGNKKQAARNLGMSYTTLRRIISQ